MNHSDRPRLGAAKAAIVVLKHIETSLECGDIARMEAAALVVASAHRDGIEAVRLNWSSRSVCAGGFVDWLTATAALRDVDKALKLSTGRSRDEWWDVV